MYSCAEIVPNRETFLMKEGIFKVADKIRMIKSDEPIIVHISGGSSSGKTTFTEKLLDLLPKGTLRIAIDDYYIGREFSEKNGFNFDQPESLDLDLLKSNLENLRQGKPTRQPIYSFLEDGGKRIGYKTVYPSRIIIVEGLFALRPEIVSVADLRIFVRANCHGRFVRRIMRDTKRTKWNPEKILEYFIETVEPMHCGYIDCQEAFADIVIDNQYDPVIESELGCSLKEKQLKIRMAGPISWNTLSQIGIEFLAESVQNDFYYAIPQQGRKDEILRIRKDGGFLLFTYKAPDTGTEIRRKNKFEFPISESGQKKIEELCQMKLRITKHRIIYAFGNVVFSQDRIFWRGENYYFLEVRGFSGKKALSSFLKKIGMEGKPVSRESYFDIFGGKNVKN